MSKTKHQTARRNVRGFVARLDIYDGTVLAEHLLETDDGHFQVYGADGCPAGVFDTIRDAAASLPKAEVVS
jgi:hypothetical protein